MTSMGMTKDSGQLELLISCYAIAFSPDLMLGINIKVVQSWKQFKIIDIYKKILFLFIIFKYYIKYAINI